jgi:PKD repeat protein
MDSSALIIQTGAISIGADGTVYVNNKNGVYYAFTPDLQTIKWQQSSSGNTYNNMALSKDGIMVLTGSGYVISAWQTVQQLPPVADFRASSRLVTAGQPVDFFDQSSFAPTAWTWNFPGASVLTSTQQDPSGIIYNNPGIYEVALSVFNAFGSDSVTKYCYLEVENPSGVSESIASPEIHLFPNPASGDVRIEGANATGRTRVLVSDILGKQVFEAEMTGGEATFDVSVLPPGMYLIRAGDETFRPARLIRR